MAIYVVIAILVGVLAVVTFAALAVGVLSLLGVLRLERCARCGHLTATEARFPPLTCAQCRHPHLAHPIASWRHIQFRHPATRHSQPIH
jgi:hypothetical protein